ncbi:MAG: hypothetical protein Q9222_003150 [Ikaeria aurantiellina]
MFDNARSIELPASFVELRHEATHGDLPSLVVLRQASEKALDWLWHHYWKHLNERVKSSDHENNLDLNSTDEPTEKAEAEEGVPADSKKNHGFSGWRECKATGLGEPIGILRKNYGLDHLEKTIGNEIH